MDWEGQEYQSLILNHPLFANLSPLQIQTLINNCAKMQLKTGEVLMKEGDRDKQCYLILKGQLEVIKIDSDQMSHQLAQLGANEIVGAIVLLDEQNRSATVRCMSDCELLVISQAMLEQLITKDKAYYHVIKNIAANICDKFRQTNETTVKALRETIEIYKIQVSMGRLMVSIIIALSFLSFFNLIASEEMKKVASSSYITVPLMLFMMVFLIIVFKFVRLPLSAYGITTKGAGRAFIGGLLYSIPVCAIAVLVKWLLIQHVTQFSDQQLFTPYAGINPASYQDPTKAWYVTVLIYGLLISPFQELMTRSGLQAPLEHLLTGRFRVVWAIIASNIIFMTAHVFMSPIIAILVLIPGLFFGWLFYKYKNIVASATAHTIIGVWGLCVVGFT